MLISFYFSIFKYLLSLSLLFSLVVFFLLCSSFDLTPTCCWANKNPTVSRMSLSHDNDLKNTPIFVSLCVVTKRNKWKQQKSVIFRLRKTYHLYLVYYYLIFVSFSFFYFDKKQLKLKNFKKSDFDDFIDWILGSSKFSCCFIYCRSIV